MRGDNRAALLRGARACLDERGYARTRARDVASAAGVSTAAIGYHFATTEALLIEALLSGMEEWSAQLNRRLESLPAHHPAANRSNRVADIYQCVVESFPGHRGVLAASFELIAQADEKPEVRQQLRHAVDHARKALAQQVLGVDPDFDPDRARRVGTACYAMLSGLIVQWLMDPDSLPEPESVIADIKALDPALFGHEER